MSELYFKQKCEHELNDTLCDTKCEAYIGGEGWYLVLADGDLLTRAEWEATVDWEMMAAALFEWAVDDTENVSLPDGTQLADLFSTAPNDEPYRNAMVDDGRGSVLNEVAALNIKEDS